MGRKIPAKKHHGVKDPLVQQAKRLESLKGKINAPPRDPDEQPVPKSLLRLFGAPAVERRERRPRPASRGGGTAPRAPHAADSVARLQRLPGESARSFSKRITGATRALHTVEDPHHYPHEEEEDEEERPSRRRGRSAPSAPRETKAQRRKLKLQQKKLDAAKLRAAEASSSLVYERVSFGEQAHAPPALPPPRLPRALRERGDAANVPRPGRRNLLLSCMLAGAGVKAGVGEAARAVAGGRGDAAAEQRRLAAVAAYRQLKKQQRHEQHERHKR